MADDPSQVSSPQSAGVPEYGGFRVSPDGQAGFPISVPDTREFGQAAQQLGQTSNEFMGQGEKIQDIAVRAQQQADQFQSFDALNKLDQAALDLQVGKNGFQNVRGGDVMHTGPNGEPLSADYATRLQQQFQSISGSLANDTQRAQFMAMSRRTVLMFNMSAAEHQEKEWNTYQETSYTGAAKQAEEYAKENLTNPEAQQHAIDVVTASIRGLGQMKGLAPSDIEASVQQGKSSLVRNLIGNAIESGNYTAGRDLYNVYGPQGKNLLLADDNLAVHSAVQKETLAQDIYNLRGLGEHELTGGAGGGPLSAPVGGKLGPIDTTKPFAQNVPGIMKAEGTANFNAFFGSADGVKSALGVAPPKPLTQMSMGDVYNWQRNVLLPASGAKNTTAAGGLQITSQNIKRFAPQLFGANWQSQPFDQAHQLAIGEAIHNEQGYGAWAGVAKAAGGGSANIFGGARPNPLPNIVDFTDKYMAQFQALHPDATVEQQEMARNAFHSAYNEAAEGRKQNDEAALGKAQSWVVNNPGKDISNMPADIRAALDPAHVEGVVQLVKEMDPSKAGEDDPNIVNGVLSGQIDLTKLSDAQMMSLQGKLKPETFQKFLVERTSALKKDFVSSQTVDKETMAASVDRNLQEMGINPKVSMSGNNATDPEMVARQSAIRGAIYDRILAKQAVIKRKLTPGEVDDEVHQAFITTAGQNNNPLFGYTAAEPGWFSGPQGGGTYMGDNALATVKASLAKRGIAQPTHAQIEQELYEERMLSLQRAGRGH